MNKTTIFLSALAVVSLTAYWQLSEEPTQAHDQVVVTPIAHATLALSWGTTTVYADPVDAAAFSGVPRPQVILVTHTHPDHFSTSTLEALMTPDTALVVPQAVYDLLPEDLSSRAKVLDNGATLAIDGLSITSVPAYNRADAENAKYHPKGVGNGYVVERDGERVYIAGDTAETPEMDALSDIDIAFLPMNLPYTMDVDEAAHAALAFRPRIVYPYHYRGTDGLSDVARFAKLVQDRDPEIQVVQADWYPTP